MAKKSQVPPAPEMTALPMASGDSPLVIDLPDGQKLIVGNLAAGSVIEVQPGAELGVQIHAHLV